MTREYSRRYLLAGLGVVGAGFVAPAVLFTGRSRAYTGYTRVPADVGSSGPRSSQAQPEQPGLRVAWWESYNGSVLETQGDGSETSATRVLEEGSEPMFVPEANGPLIDVGNVLPGDEGIVGIGIEADIPPGQEVAVWFRTQLLSTSENGINEPESEHPDENPNDPDDGGELDDTMEVTVWENSGLAGIGANDGTLMPLVEDAIKSGSLREVFDGPDDPDIAGGYELGCLETGETTYVALRWALPTDVGNVVQSDSATFGIEFRAAPCGGSNPFVQPGNSGGGNGNGNPNGGGSS